MDYEKIYKEVREYFDNFTKGCDNCKHTETERIECAYCNEFSNWDFDIKVLDNIEKTYE